MSLITMVKCAILKGNGRYVVVGGKNVYGLQGSLAEYISDSDAAGNHVRVLVRLPMLITWRLVSAGTLSAVLG